MLTGPPRRRRARPVADVPIDALLDRTEDLTKGWLLALLERAPLEDAPRILAADLIREGPRVCAAMLRAIADETDHRRLEPGGALEPLAARVGELAGAVGAAATSLAVDALQSIVWSALRSELRDPDPDLITELAERLAQVTALMRAAALSHEAGAGPARVPLSAVPRAGSGRETDPVPEPAACPLPEEPALPVWEEPAAPAGVAPVAPAGVTPVAPAGVAPVASAGEDPALAPSPPVARGWGEPAGAAVGSEPPALWIGALEDEIRTSADAQLSLLLAELEDADHVLAVEPGTAGRGAFGDFARAVREVARRQDILVCETDARAWVIARDTGRTGAQALGTRIAAAVRAREPWRGAPLSASVGVAVLGEDGRSAAELIDAAEEARFAAAAEGRDVLRPVPADGSSAD